MTTQATLYRVQRERRYNGGGRVDEVQSVEVLYCGYDRDEARRVYHAHRPTDSRNTSPGAYYTVTKCKRSR